MSRTAVADSETPNDHNCPDTDITSSIAPAINPLLKRRTDPHEVSLRKCPRCLLQSEAVEQIFVA